MKIRIEYKKAVEIEKETAVDTVHFDKNNGEEPEVIESEVNRTEAAAEEEGKDDTVKAVEFESAQFSVYGIIGSYTVDFRWEVDGKTYDFSLPGGGFVSFTDLVEVLGLTGDANSAENDMDAAEENDTDAAEENDTEAADTEATALMLDDIAVSEETRKFVADVESVEFSSPELVWVGKVENDSTVSELREAYGLVSFISGEPTEEQIAEINAQTVEAGDWAIVSLAPFTSEEALTVTMKNGERFAISVTDGQEVTNYSDVDRDGFYIIYVDNVIRHWSGPFYYWDEHQYYALRKDGASVRVENNNLDALGNEFLWKYDYDEHACWWYNGSNYIEPEWSMVVGSDPNGRYLWVDQRWDGAGFDIHGDYWSNNYLSWDNQNGFIIANNNSVPIRIYEREKPIYNFKVETNNENYGSVSCEDTVTDNDFKNAYDIIATPADDCYFVGWHLGDSILSPDEYGSTIPAGALEFPEDGLTLTAVFGKNYTSPATQEINEWVDSLLGNPLVSDKTAHVHDYDNRIYEIDLSASSSRYTIDQDIRIEFITDISRSMYFPETLMNEQDFGVNGQINLGQWLLDNGDPEQVYYVIGDINNTATMYAVYFSGNNYFTRWSIVDASYYLPYDGASTSGRIKTVCEISNGRTSIYMTDRFDGNANRIFTGKIYNSTPKPPKDTADWDRLSYLTAAVNAVSRAIYRLDPGAEIGLVTFASSASGGTLYGAEDEASFITALHSIQPTGGTNQTSAFNLINNSDPPVFELNSGKRQVALLITDGAPQGTTWDAIERAAGNTKANDVEVWTLGLALDRVGNNKQRLMDLASAGGYSGNAEDPDQLVTETKKILQEMLVKASTIGEVYDTVDPAFYPVDASGDPIEAGFYYADTEGGNVTKHSAAPSDAAKPYYQWVDDNGTWKITYYNQEIKWPEEGGWNSSFYIKAKEDFMGGNTISTNNGVDNRIEVNRIKHSGPPEGYYWLKEDHSSFRDDFAMPYVNVDELSLTENSTEWTVYLGTEVDPATELKALWDQILVNQVVKDNGEDDEVITITSGSQMYYSDEPLNDAAAPDGTANETLPLSHFVNADIIDSLIQMLDNGETTATAMRSYRYFPYGHDVVGTFDIVLTKTLTDDDAAEDHAPYEHETKETGDRREVYTLTVTYNPTNNDASDIYDQTTPDHTAGKVADGYDADTGELIQSKNTHIINVFAKKLQLLKVDQSNQTITGGTGAAAEFGLYRKATAEEEADDSVTKVPLSGLTGNYVLVQSLTTENGTVTTESLSLVKGQEPYDEPYYLVETNAPDGYLALEEPLKVSIDLEDHNTWGRYTATTEYSEGETYYVFNDETYEYEEADISSQADISGSDVTVFRFVPRSQSKPDPYELSDWLQEAAVIVTALDGTDSSAAIRVIPEGQHGITYDHTDDTTDASVEYMIVNNAGCELPSTGGPGTNLIYLLGIMLTGIAGAGLLMRRKKKAA